MNPALFLYLIRIITALLLLGFVGVIAWLIYREMQVTEQLLMEQEKPPGQLRVVGNQHDQSLIDTIFPLLPVTSIGRANGNTIVLPDGFASGQHALIVYRNGRWWLEDQGSRNGTLLNDVTITETAVLTTGDLVEIGGTEFRVEL